jgi:hypothetical protein
VTLERRTGLSIPQTIFHQIAKKCAHIFAGEFQIVRENGPFCSAALKLRALYLGEK